MKADSLTTVAWRRRAPGRNPVAALVAALSRVTRVRVVVLVVVASLAGLTVVAPPAWAAPPANDSFADALVLEGPLPVSVAGSNVDATKEPGEPDHAGNPGGASVWYQWTATTTGEAAVDTCAGGDFDTLLAVYTGPDVASLTTVASNDDVCGNHSATFFPTSAGTTYWIAVDGFNGAQGELLLTLPLLDPPPANDNLAAAEELAGSLPISVTGTNVAATREPGEPFHVSNHGGASVWYRWTATDSHRVKIDTCGSDFNSIIAVYTGAEIGQLSAVAANDNICGVQSAVTFAAVAGTAYTIAVSGFSDPQAPPAQGAIVLTIGPGDPPPTNDNFAAAEALTQTLPVNVTATSAGASREPGEPRHGSNEGGASVWFRWTATESVGVVIETCNSDNSWFDTVLAVYTGSAVEALSTVATVDDGCDAGYLSRIEFGATAGTTYYIAVDGFDTAQGNIALSIRSSATVIPGSGTAGRADPYPIQIPISGLDGVVDDVNVTLTDLTHSNPADLDILLAAPDGVSRALFFSDAGGGTDLVGADLVFDDEAPTAVPGDAPLVSGTYQPTDPEAFAGQQEMLTPAPGTDLPPISVDSTHGLFLSALNGIDPNGVWTLWIVDDQDGNAGSLGDVTLDITTETPTYIPAAGSRGPANPYPISIPVSGATGPIRDLNVTLSGLTHTAPIDLDILLVAPDGVTRSWIMSDAGGFGAYNEWLVFDDETTGTVPDHLHNANGVYRPINATPDDVLPAPAPQGPAPASLAVFDGLDPNGTWTLYIFDDTAGNIGHLYGVGIDAWAGVRISAGIGIPGPAEPYPLEIPIEGLSGVITDLNVHLNGWVSWYPFSVDMLLVAPDGATRSFVVSDAGGAFNDIVPRNLTIDDEAEFPVPDFGEQNVTEGTFRPTNTGGQFANDDLLPPPAPDSTTALTSLAVFDGLDPNGVWRLYIHEAGFGDVVGQLAGVTLDITTVEPAVIPATETTGAANPYPIAIPISGHGDSVADVNVAVDRIVHQSAADVDMLLVAPDGRTSSWLMSDAGGAEPVNARLTFDDEAAGDVPNPIVTGTYRPTNAETDDRLPRPAPPHNRRTSLSAFDGLDPNGTWTLFVYDDSPGSVGSLANITLDIATAVRIPATGTSGQADPYPLEIPISGLRGVVGDLNVTLTGLHHTLFSDIDMLLVAPDGTTRSWVMSDQPAGQFMDALDVDLVVDDEASVAMPGFELESGTFRPTDSGTPSDDVLPAPAPQGPAPASLASFDGIDPNGVWTLYINDDRAGPPTGQSRGGFGTLGAVSLDITTVTPTTIPASRAGRANPYPIEIPVAGHEFPIQDLNVELTRLNHASPTDLDLLLVAPDGVTRTWIMSDAGGTTGVDTSLTIDDDAATDVPSQLVSGTYRPTNTIPDDALPRPAPQGSAPTSLSVFDGLDPDGTWTLYVYDDTAGAGGSLGNVTLDLTTGTAAGPGAIIPGVSGMMGPANPYPIEVQVTGQIGTIADLDVVLNSLNHTCPTHLDILLVAPDGITRTWLLSDAGGCTDLLNADIVFNDQATDPVGVSLGAGAYRPTNHNPDDVLPAPAPAGPAATSLGVFDGLNPNGTWTLYIFQDAYFPSGELEAVTLQITTSV